MTTIYNFHPVTGRFLGESPADESPLEPGVFLVPANATTIAPPAIGAGQCAVFKDGAWALEQLPEPAQISLQSMINEAQARIDRHYADLYYSAVPNGAIAAEYDAAYMVAKRWLENQGEPVPERVKALAESYGVTNLQAAQVVVTKWIEAQAVAFDLRGAARLRAKLAIRQAVDLDGVAAAELAGRAAMEAVVYSV